MPFKKTRFFASLWSKVRVVQEQGWRTVGQNSKKCSKTSTIHSYDFEVWMTSTLHLIYFSKIHFLSPPHSTYSCPNLWFIEWSVEVLFFWKENDKTLAKLTPNKLWCFPQKELIPFSGENTSLKENLYEILPNFCLFNTIWGECRGVEIFTWSHYTLTILWAMWKDCGRIYL